MKFAFLAFLLVTLTTLSWCWKKDDAQNWNVVWSEQSETSILSENIPEPIGEEDIIPQYLADSSSTQDTNTDEKILFFYSENSEKSKEFDVILSSTERPEIFSDIIKVNIDDESEAKENYWVIEANTFVLIDESGALVKKIENVWNIENILTLYE